MPGRRSQNNSQSQAAASQDGDALSRSERNRLTAAVVRYVLTSHGRGDRILYNNIRRLLPEQHRRSLREIMDAASSQLEDVFGLKLVRLNDSSTCVVINKLSVDQKTPHLLLGDHESQRRGLLMVVLSVIFMNGGQIEEDALWAFLEKLVDNNCPVEAFGDIKKLISKEWVLSRYLRTETVGQGKRNFCWGDRAFREMDGMNVLTFVCNVWGEDVTPEMWTEQYQRAQQQQEQ